MLNIFNFEHSFVKHGSTMVRKWRGNGDEACCILIFVAVVCLMPSLVSSHLSPLTDITIRKEPGVCQSRDIRNSVKMLSQLRGCQVVEGFVQIVLIDNALESDYANISFPELKEITGYLLLYRVNGLRSLGTLFPNLAVIRGNTLFLNYALIVFEMLHLQEIGLRSLTDIVRGAMYFAKNPMLCFIGTINWDLIAANGKEDHYITGNKPPMECPMCPANQSCPTTNFNGESLTLCWNTHHCQKVCPAECAGSCTDRGECCHPYCLGGCTSPSPADCLACKHFYFQKNCVKSCPQNTYEYIGRRCVMESECYDMPKPREVNEDVRNNPWIPFNGHCVLECPTGYSDVERNGTHKCESCQGVCKKECTGINVDSIASVQKLRGCTIIKGALEIQIRGGSNVVKELEENLNMVEEIDDYLKIVRSFPLVSLNFLKKLKVIHGKTLESSKYALVVLDNQNLVDLWDWNTRVEGLEIKNGRIFFHFNPKLCLSKIEALKVKAKLDFYTELEVASNSNGDKVACNIKLLKVTVYKKNSVAALIKWKQFEHYDSRTLLGYVVYSIEAPFRNVTMYDGRDACGGDGWRVDDVNASDASDGSGAEELNHILTRLKPYTQYAFYVRTYTIATENSGAQSPIQYFWTDPDTPSEPRFLTAYSNSSSELVVSWQAPLHPNGDLTHYLVTGRWERDREDFIEQRNYCLEPHPQPITSHIPTKSSKEPPKRREPDELDELSVKSCPCKKKVVDNKQREKEIYFEDHLQNQIYVKRTNTNRVKRDLRDDVETSLESILPGRRPDGNSSHSFIDGIHFSQIVNSTSLVMRGLRHFALYNIAVRACRKWEPGENDTKNNNCSEEAIVTARTLPMATADNLESKYPVWEIHNNSAGDILLRWNEPQHPNSLIVAYQIEYMRKDIGKGKYVPTIECITRKEFVEAGKSYIIKNLAPGNYSLRLRATSLYGTGNFTPYKYFVIKEAGQMSLGLFLILIAFPIIFIIAFFILMTIYYVKKQYNRLPPGKLIAAVNPEYVPTVYEADDWEVSRHRVNLLREIGQGSFGMVYEGILESLTGAPDQLCAVKTVNVQATEKERIDFLNEASVMKAFSTHHVVKLLGVVSVGQPTLVVMELMKHGDLKSFLRSHRPDGTIPTTPTHPHHSAPPTLKRILRMAAEIADGMAYLSAKKFVHRDLAARNCMVAEDLTVKIGDFGMTRDIYETDYYRKGSKGLLPVRWMAPESLKDGIFTSYSDAWSYGIVLYEMVTLASQPYQGLSNDQVLRYVIDGGTMDRPENCPDKLYHVMKLCWENKPSNRPSFIEIVSLLQEDLEEDFQTVSFYHCEEGVEYRATITSEDTPLRVSREIEDFSLSEDEDYKEPRRLSATSNPHPPLLPPQQLQSLSSVSPPLVKTTNC